VSGEDWPTAVWTVMAIGVLLLVVWICLRALRR
jgi:hypothetical protein